MNDVLLQSLARSFTLDELRSLCFELNIPYEDLGGEGLSGKARELLLWAERHGRLPELLAALRRARPAADWPDVASLTTLVASPAPPPSYSIIVGGMVNSNAAIGPNATLNVNASADHDDHPPNRAA